MGTVKLWPNKAAYKEQAAAVAAAVTVTVTYTGSDKWDTGDGSKQRTFNITLPPPQGAAEEQGQGGGDEA